MWRGRGRWTRNLRRGWSWAVRVWSLPEDAGGDGRSGRGGLCEGRFRGSTGSRGGGPNWQIWCVRRHQRWNEGAIRRTTPSRGVWAAGLAGVLVCLGVELLAAGGTQGPRDVGGSGSVAGFRGGRGYPPEARGAGVLFTARVSRLVPGRRRRSLMDDTQEGPQHGAQPKACDEGGRGEQCEHEVGRPDDCGEYESVEGERRNFVHAPQGALFSFVFGCGFLFLF